MESDDATLGDGGGEGGVSLVWSYAVVILEKEMKKPRMAALVVMCVALLELRSMRS